MASKLVAPTRKPIRLPPVRPNAGIEAAYRDRLERMIAAMHASIVRAVTRAWRAKPPEMAQDESPAAALRAIMERLRRHWTDKFAELADGQARRFAGDALKQTDRAFAAQLRRAGFTVKFQISREVNDVFRATVSEQVNLIRSIPEQHLTQVEGAVMRSVQVGRDIGGLTKELEHQFGVTHRRAAIIARDQNNKATATIMRARQQELGITEAVWLHSLGGRHPRPEHLAFNGKRYEIAKGAFLEGKWTWPGVEINCRCVSKSIIPGLN